jgi:ABC-type Fe3+-hydroxamate transport system substrate-binding protein
MPELRPPHPRPRVVSLLPSATEVLCAVGGQSLLVGRSHECDFPPGLETSPVLTAPRIGPVGPGNTPAQIDAQVRAAAKQGAQSLYHLFADRLGALAPDVILTQDLCEVCSIDLGTVRNVAATMRTASGEQPRIVSLNPHTVEAVFDDCLTVGQAVGLDREATNAVVRLRERLYEAGEFVNPYDEGPPLAFLEWTDPLFCAGHWTVQLIERAGCTHPFNPTRIRDGAGAAAGPQQGEKIAGKSVRMPAEVLVAAKPEYLVICPCGLTLEQTRVCAADLAKASWWRELPAVRKGRVAIVDGNQMFNRPGPRLVDAYEWLVGWIQERPALIPAGFPWERFAE